MSQHAFIDSLNNKAFPEIEAKDINKAELIVRDALEQSLKIGYKKGEADAYLRLGVVKIRQGDRKAITEYVNKAINLYEQDGNTNHENYGLAFILISGSFEQERDYLKCMNYARKSLTISKEIQNTYINALAHRMMGQAYRGMRKYDSSFFHFHHALEAFIKLNNLKHIGAIYGNLGINHYLQKNYEKAIEFTEKNYDISRKLKNQTDYTISFGNLAEYHYLLGAYQKSMHCLDSAQYYGIKFQQADVLNSIYRKKGKVYAKLGEADSVRKYLDLAIFLQDSVFRDDYRKELTKARAQLELHQQESANKLLAKDKDIAVLQRNFAIAGFVSIIALFGLVLVRQRFKVQERVKQQLEHEVQLRTEEIVKQKEEITIVATSLQQANNAIQEKNKALLELNETKNKLLSVVSHDLKAPLNTLRGTMDAIGRGYISEEEFKQLSTTIRRQLEETANLLDNLLLWARSQFLGNGSSSSTIDLKTIIEKNSMLFHQDLVNKDIAFVNQSAHVQVAANEDEINTVVRNLLVNAIKFTPKEGRISVATDVEDNHVVLKISDTGVGMTSEQINKLFSQQTISTRGTNHEKGTGLGLFLCKELIEKNGGCIGVSSSSKTGSTFFVKIPVV